MGKKKTQEQMETPTTKEPDGLLELGNTIADVIIELQQTFTTRQISEAFKVARAGLKSKGVIVSVAALPDLEFGDVVTVNARRNGANEHVTGRYVRNTDRGRVTVLESGTGKFASGRFVSKER